MSWWDAVLRIFVEIGTPLIVGSLIVATVTGVLAYPFTRWLLHSVSGPHHPTEEEADARQKREPVSTAAD
jgi:uncharacterized protein (DUF2062 family)